MLTQYKDDLLKEIAELSGTNETLNAEIENKDNQIAELKKQLEVERNTRARQLDSLRKELPSIIGKVVGQIEFAKPINKKTNI